jgi:hypothetical protein
MKAKAWVSSGKKRAWLWRRVDIEDERPGVVLGLDARVLEGRSFSSSFRRRASSRTEAFLARSMRRRIRAGERPWDLEAVGGLPRGGEALGELGEAVNGLEEALSLGGGERFGG